MVCLNGYFDRGHQYETKFYGCKHILLEEYDILRDELQPRKYIFEKNASTSLKIRFLDLTFPILRRALRFDLSSYEVHSNADISHIMVFRSNMSFKNICSAKHNSSYRLDLLR